MSIAGKVPVKPLDGTSSFSQFSTAPGFELSGRGGFPRRVSAKIQLFYARKQGKNSFNFTSTPAPEARRVGFLLKSAFKPSPTTNAAPQVFPLSKREVPLPL